MNEIELEQLQKELSDLRTENDELKNEVKRLKGAEFNAEDYIKKLQQQAERDKAAEEALKARFL